ncbi:amino acid/amide ABC transporter membrane protein 2 (HAAT family) [Homoserinimonas aerilata]|uniref:Amino acid/amide ABC transporter membrane protein 2 (HAAT family) n=1 Tax=Homoserinimonas aerilata TaxID=1162970 RepID=A0A542YA26_9MICO|nr:branched-chain amino acid ABC transporter permease [Homoserinimonas aerilata]TQL44956.1 amino acid/amide ABC transporter membrane protein 2 (HAAT family) [Homoserinimonas aerilata]
MTPTAVTEKSAPIRSAVSRWSKTSVFGTAGMLVLVVVLAALPYLINLGTLYALIDLFILLILASTWNLLAGYGGMVSIGQQAYIGIGAYGLVSIADVFGINVFLAIPIAALVSALVAVPVSYLAFRLVGGYFAVGTWVIAEVFRLIAIQIPEIGGGAGISLGAMAGIPRDLRIALTYWVALACAVIIIAACVLLVRSRFGLALTAVRDDPRAAATSGVNVQVSKRLVFVMAAAGAGVGGALMALSTLRVQPDGVFSVQWAAFMIFIVVVGGVGTLEGPLLGVVVFWALKQSLADFGPLYLILLGIIGVVFVLYIKRGVWGLLTPRGKAHLFPVGYRVRLDD